MPDRVYRNLGMELVRGTEAAALAAVPETAIAVLMGVGDTPDGVIFDCQGGVTTQSIVTRALSGLIRFIRGVHQLNSKHVFGNVDIDQAVRIAVY